MNDRPDQNPTTEMLALMRAELASLEATIPALQKDVLEKQSALRREDERVKLLKRLLDLEVANHGA